MRARTLPSSSGRALPRPTSLTASARPTRRNTTGCPVRAARVAASSTAPPPSARTPVCVARASATALTSRSRKYASPESTKISATLRPSAASMSESVSRTVTPHASASRPATVVLPAPIGPTSTARGPSAWDLSAQGPSAIPQGVQIALGRCAGSRSRRRRRTSPRPPRRARAPPSPPRRCPLRARRRRRSAGDVPRSARRWRRRRCAEPAGLSRSASSPARTRRSSPGRHARPRCRRSAPTYAAGPASVATISSWASEPGVAARPKPSPTSTPLMAWMPIRAPAGPWHRNPLVQWTCEPEPWRQSLRHDLDGDTAQSVAVAPGRCARPSARWRRGRGSARDRRRDGPRSPLSGPVRRQRAPPPPRTRPRGSPAGPRRPARGTPTRRGRAPPGLPSRAPRLARGMGPPSSKPYFCMPTRSAWPGRGRVSAALRGDASRISGSTGSADITCSHLGALGVADHRSRPVPPASRRGETPPTMVDLVGLGLHPRAPPVAESPVGQGVGDVVGGIRTCAGRPSRIATREGPWDSPAVSERNMGLSLSSREECGKDRITPQDPTTAPTSMNGPNVEPLRSHDLPQREQRAEHAAQHEAEVDPDDQRHPSRAGPGRCRARR